MSRVTKLLSVSPYACVDFGNQLIDDFGTIVPPSPEQVDAARRYVAGVARDVEDARELLAMLGLGGEARSVIAEAARDLLAGEAS